MCLDGPSIMTKDQLISLIRKILKTDPELKFLEKLDPEELEMLAACIRGSGRTALMKGWGSPLFFNQEYKPNLK